MLVLWNTVDIGAAQNLLIPSYRYVVLTIKNEFVALVRLSKIQIRPCFFLRLFLQLCIPVYKHRGPWPYITGPARCLSSLAGGKRRWRPLKYAALWWKLERESRPGSSRGCSAANYRQCQYMVLVLKQPSSCRSPIACRAITPGQPCRLSHNFSTARHGICWILIFSQSNLSWTTPLQL